MTNTPQTVGRRERLRAQTLQEIEDVSFAIIDADGVQALSIAALARSMAMSAPAVYRYFPSRDALVAHLVTLSYQQLAAAMSQAVEGSRKAPRTRVRLVVTAYRDWALRYRRRYGMLFGERAGDLPDEVTTQTPLDQAMAFLIDLLVAVQDTAPADSTSGDRTLDGQLRRWARSQGRPDVTPGVALAANLIWTRVHGIVSLELTGVFANQAVEAQRLIDLEIDNAIQSLRPTGAGS
ncbi:TetR/AcrR family transcriptional regulator [Streptomyces turgidiscabies]|uniref:Transcriptional regulator, TetR family n=1 Tax=Streptomyces turgidiscabies (strain Car8) TaxID=698760 RepID=L7EZT6_STRT8|nr:MULTISPECIES: TetR/AcrR family transcriptional regulator [Streptomyces]ELP64226.1 transcriptional regulator, TetR family [Streptomyces turgidiscabies Car8]MDX3495727.1 TetR/AcrR family transcriptional regulator [Streptomyces turgidiscabies]GAQ75500.1 putative HTH-type transcriptional [Streptomyces turgidiscabies]